MAEVCSRLKECNKVYTKIYSETLKGKDNLGDLGVFGRIISEWVVDM
jgi:hypothetical protein